MIGQTISHYKILEKLGEGGMGVVYKAHDTKLDRDVALKFLPDEVSLSEEERNRFTHEAKSASALEHPNICTIHEVGETPEGQMFIVMGYYDGISISRRVEKGKLDLSEAVSIAIQIAEGLQAAHEKGIVHRDIKSSNIIVSDKGQVRILDFGLARKRGLSKLTKTGTTVGTASYMSPEQARGETIDHRSDLWSLGVVLYEMVTGKLPFRGDHEAAILYSVVNEEPKPLEVSVSGTSPELIHIISRALEKDIGERYQSAAEMLTDLKRLKKETSRTGHAAIVGGKKKSSSLRNKAILTVFIMLTISAAGYLYFLKKGGEINPDWRSRPLEISLKDIGYPGISGDGNWIAFGAFDNNGRAGLYIMNTISGGPRFITKVLHPSGTYVDVSVDGSHISYDVMSNVTDKMEINIIPSNGGTPRNIVHNGGAGARFQPDGKRIGYILGWYQQFNPSPSGKLEFWSVGIDGNDHRREFIDTVSLTDGSVAFSYSPDARNVAWLRTFPGPYQEIIIHNLESGRENTITSDKKYIDEISWVRQNQIVYTTNKSGIANVWMVQSDGGEPVQITKGTDPISGVKASADGQKIIYVQQTKTADFWIVDIEKNRSYKITSTEENQYFPKLSPNGKMIAFIIGAPSEYGTTGANLHPSHLFVMDRDGNNRRQLSFGDEVVWSISWSPDGKRIAYGSRRPFEPVDSFRTYVIELSNPGSPKYISKGSPRAYLDSARIQVGVNDTIYVASEDDSSPIRVYDDSTNALFAMEGKYIVYHDRHKGKDLGVWITDGMIPRELQRKNARLLAWDSRNIKLSGDGKILYSHRGVDEIWRMILPNGKEERINADFLSVENFFDFYPSWDGKEIIVIKRRSLNKIVMIENLFK